MKHKIKWGRSKDGFVDSKGKRFGIQPVLLGCASCQAYELFDFQEHKQIDGLYKTQRQAKQRAEEVISPQVKVAIQRCEACNKWEDFCICEE